MRAHKYKAVRTEVDGISFASKKEARRYGELKLLERAGEIQSLKLQPRYPLWCDNKILKTVTGREYVYVADFAYVEKGEMIIEDTKGMKTELYKLKRAIMEANGYKIRET